MTHVTCRLTAKNRDQLRNPTLGSRVWATFTFFILLCVCSQLAGRWTPWYWTRAADEYKACCQWVCFLCILASLGHLLICVCCMNQLHVCSISPSSSSYKRQASQFHGWSVCGGLGTVWLVACVKHKCRSRSLAQFLFLFVILKKLYR